MAKMTRAKLKGIVKECLVEILSEGISSTNLASENSVQKKKLKEQTLRQEQVRLDQKRKNLDKRFSEQISGITQDSVMREILQDTARTTFQEQISHDRNPGSVPGSLSAGDPGINLDNIFSESADVWSKLAFADKKIS